jgi:hypothetical protein
VGFTLVELVIAIGAMTMLLVAVGGLVHACLRAESTREDISTLYEEGFLAMERMVAGAKRCTHLLIPNNHSVTRDILAFSESANADADFYFGDNLFARVNEDLSSDMSNDAAPGIKSLDDDGDGTADEAGALAWSDAVNDDDEDGAFDEDWLDGKDNDADGNIDEDVSSDANADGQPGLAAFDDDADGSIDEGAGGSSDDDDEDEDINEDAAEAIVYTLVPSTNTLVENKMRTMEVGVLCENVTAFTVIYHPPGCTVNPYITISLTLTGDGGETITLQEDVYPRNIVQGCGRRVR